MAVMQRIRRGDAVGFSEPEWLAPKQVDDAYFRILPTGQSEITVEEIAELAALFGEDGELAAERLS